MQEWVWGDDICVYSLGVCECAFLGGMLGRIAEWVWKYVRGRRQLCPLLHYGGEVSVVQQGGLGVHQGPLVRQFYGPT